MQDVIMIPYNEAGQRAFDVLCRVAEKLYTAAQAAVSDYIAQNLSPCQTVTESHRDGKYSRTVQTPDGGTHTVGYDYRTKRVEAA